MRIKVEIHAEDIQDVKSHLSVIRTQILAILSGKAVPSEESLNYEGIGSSHSITIEE
jgi:hypothetical protein